MEFDLLQNKDKTKIQIKFFSWDKEQLPNDTKIPPLSKVQFVATGFHFHVVHLV